MKAPVRRRRFGAAVISLGVALFAAAGPATSPANAATTAPVTPDAPANGLALIVDPNGSQRAAPDGQPLYYLVDRDSLAKNVVYGFTTQAAIDRYAASRKQSAGKTESAPVETCPDARFNNAPYGTAPDWLTMPCGHTNPYLNDRWNDTISYAEAGGSWTILYKCYNYFVSLSCITLAIEGGVTYANLYDHNFNNYTSSIKVCPAVMTLSECRNY